MPITKSRRISKLVKLDGNIKEEVFDSDVVALSGSLGIVGGVGMKIVSSADTLPAIGSNGDQAYVTSTNRLYVYTGSGWYNIALVNSSPVFTISPNSTYELSTTGAQTNITVLAIDSDESPITYSTVTDSNFDAFASIAKDSDNGRSFTVTVDSDASSTGSGTVTFRASDGVNIATAVSTFSITFTVINSHHSVLLLKSNDSDNDTGTLTDRSSNNYTLTRTGSPQQCSFSPYHPGGYSLYFGGNDNIEVAEHESTRVGDSDFTIEAWIYNNEVSSTGLQTIFAQGASGIYAPFNLYISNGGSGQPGKGKFVVPISSTGNSWDITDGNNSGLSSGTYENFQWIHVALVRQGSSFKLYVNGTLDSTIATSSATLMTPTEPSAVGARRSLGEGFGGWIRDVRLVIGHAVYTGNFTPPTEPLTSITNTKLLLCSLPYVALTGDASANARPISEINGTPQTHRFGPYDHLQYDKTLHGGSIDFRNGNNYYRAPFSITGVNNITVEAWIYMENVTTHNVIYTQYPNSNPTAYPGRHLFYVSSGTGKLQYWTSSDGVSEHSHVLELNTWYHVAYVKSGNTVKLYVNGNGQTGVGTHDVTIFNENLTIGAVPENSNWFAGQISDLRITYNDTTYTGDFTPPTAPLSADSDTKLLTAQNDNGVWCTQGRVLHRTTATPSNVSRKFQSSSSIVYSGDAYILVEQKRFFHLGDKDFTFETWLAFTSTSSDTVFRRVFMASDGGNVANNFQILVNPGGGNQYGSAGSLMVWAQNASNASSWITTDTTTFNDGNWHHLAATRQNGTVRLFVDGTKYGTDLTSWTHGPTGNVAPRISAYSTASQGNFSGYMQDLRYTIGLARYTANFTPPTEEFKG